MPAPYTAAQIAGEKKATPTADSEVWNIYYGGGILKMENAHSVPTDVENYVEKNGDFYVGKDKLLVCVSTTFSLPT